MAPLIPIVATAALSVLGKLLSEKVIARILEWALINGARRLAKSTESTADDKLVDEIERALNAE